MYSALAASPSAKTSWMCCCISVQLPGAGLTANPFQRLGASTASVLTLSKIGIPPTTFYRWYDRLVEHGPEGMEDRPSAPSRVWNRIPETVRDRILTLALEEPELSPRELTVKFTDTEKYFISEASVYRLLKSHDLITSPAYIAIKAADEFKDKTTAPNQMCPYGDCTQSPTG